MVWVSSFAHSSSALKDVCTVRRCIPTCTVVCAEGKEGGREGVEGGACVPWSLCHSGAVFGLCNTEQRADLPLLTVPRWKREERSTDARTCTKQMERKTHETGVMVRFPVHRSGTRWGYHVFL